MCVLDDVNTQSLVGSGFESFVVARYIGDEEVLMGRRFWVGCGFFSWGAGGGEEKETEQVLLSRFRRTTHTFKQDHFLYYI